MKFLIDTNVILDVLLKREPFYSSCVNVLHLSKQEDIDLYVSASAITDIFYIANQALKDKVEVKNLLAKLIKIISVAGVSEDEIINALELPWKDFEDSVQYSVALLQEMDGIVTRNPNDYQEAEIKIWAPEEFFEQNRKSIEDL